MEQYNKIKRQYPEHMVLLRIGRAGDNYETYDDDAGELAKICHLTAMFDMSLQREVCSFPHHMLDTYLPKIVKSGRKVVICDLIKSK